MNLVQNFGKDALDMMRWIETVEFPDSWLIKEYHKHLSQPMGTWMFVRGEEPWRKQYIINGESPEDADRMYDEDMKAWKNWTPMFEGEWEIEEISLTGTYIKLRGNYPTINIDIFKSLNDFLTQVTGLKYHDKYTI